MGGVHLLLALLGSVSGWQPVLLQRLQRGALAVSRPAAQPPAQRAALVQMAVEPGERPQAFLGSTFGSNSAMFYRQGTLVLEDGTRLRGVSFGYEGDVAGELVFTTGMVGYPESLTDPSYEGQFLVSTFPLVGNYGVPDPNRLDDHGLARGFESNQIQASALIVQDYSRTYSHWEADMSLGEWLRKEVRCYTTSA